MGIEPRFNMNQINSYLQERINTLDELMIRNLNYLGVECVNLAKNLDTYQVQTGNLKNSIGYIIVKHGNILNSVFEVKERGPKYDSNETPGEVVGENFAKEIAIRYPQGYCLIVVAGMEYASYVEDVHKQPVLQPSQVLAKTRINQIAQSIVNTMRKRE
ncbi:Uncharacterised protein [Chryseobacterium nakagawai]|uniref:Uncharacterized protein n=2 Tax=Chryseobacterium nakagawai TaxID=1241982 RepID=A0AAD1DR63_CHRNA|nr:hypothetical protein EG343_11065 [Chryseobacterium nakagawai]VEH22690.1 Uncharacterised protein [Chryseobacterium nakagawai]